MSGGWFLVALTLALGAYSGGAWQLHRTFDGGRALLPVAAAPTAGGDTTPATDRVRLTAGDTSARPGVDMRRRAEELAQAGTERFSEVLGGGKPDMSASERRRLAQAPAVREGQDRAPARPPLSEAPLGAIQSWFDSSRREYARIMAHLSVGPSTRGRLPPGAVSDWLGRADADFQMIMRGLAVARSGLPGAALPKVARGDGVPRPPQAPSTAVAPDAARRLALKETEDARREAEARARRATEEARRTSEAARKAAEAARREAADREAAERARREAEEKRLAEVARREAEQKRTAERAHREAEEKRLAEAARREAEARRAAEEERRQAEASRRAAERERLSEAQKRAEAARREAAARQAAEKAREEAEARRVAEAARRQAEVKRAADAARKAADEARRAALAKQAEEDARKVAEAARRRAEADKAKRKRVAVAVPQQAPAPRTSAANPALKRQPAALPAKRPAPRARTRATKPAQRAAPASRRTTYEHRRRVIRWAARRKVGARGSRHARWHKVRRGDSLWRISRRYYGKGRYYAVIRRANRKRLGRAAAIQPGQRIRVPRKGR